MVNRHFILFALAFAAALSGFAKTFDVDISTGRPAASNEAYYHGETIEFRAVRGHSIVTNIEYAAIYYQTNGMDSVWWHTDGLVFHPTNDVGAASYRFFLEGREIVGSGGVESGGVDSPTPSLTHSPTPSLTHSPTISRDWHANGLLRLLPSPGFTPNTIELPVSRLDFAAVEVLNAPYYDKAETEAKIVELAPAPGDYANVSNAAVYAAITNALQDAAIESNRLDIASNSASISALFEDKRDKTDMAAYEVRDWTVHSDPHVFDDFGLVEMDWEWGGNVLHGWGRREDGATQFFISYVGIAAAGFPNWLLYYNYPGVGEGAAKVEGAQDAGTLTATLADGALTITMTRNADPVQQVGWLATRHDVDAEQVRAQEAERDLSDEIERKQDALLRAQLDNIAAVPDKANKSDLPYSIKLANKTTLAQVATDLFPIAWQDYGEPYAWHTITDSNGCSLAYRSEYMIWQLTDTTADVPVCTFADNGDFGSIGAIGEMTQVNAVRVGANQHDPYGDTGCLVFSVSVSVADRAVNQVELTENTPALSAILPAQTDGRSRDFLLRVDNTATGAVDATATVVGAILVDAAGTAIASLAAPAGKVVVYRLTETDNYTASPSYNPEFVVRGANMDQQIARKLDSASAFPEFSINSTYAVGDVVTHEGGLYVCSTAVETAGPWDADDWTATTIAAGIKTAIDEAIQLADVIDDKLVPTEGPGTSEVSASGGNAVTYLAGHLPAWTCNGTFQSAVERNRGASEQSYHYDPSLFPDRIVLWVEGKSGGEQGLFTRSIVFPKAGVYTLDIEYAAGYASYPNTMGQARFVVDAGTSGPQDIIGINDPSIVQHAQVQFAAAAGNGSIVIKGKTGLSPNCCVVIASVKVTLVKEIGIEIGDIVAPDADAQIGQAADAKATGEALAVKADKSDVDPLIFAQYYPDGSAKSAAEFTGGIKYDFNDADHTASVKPFCNTGTAADDNSSLAGRVVIPPFVDAQGNGYISDDGTRYKVVGVSNGDIMSSINTNLTAIITPNTVTSIGHGAFVFCSSLVSVSLPAVERFGVSVFNVCKALTSVSLPTVATIDAYAFESCDALTSISLPAATSIGDGEFFNCTKLTSVDFGDTPRPSVPSLGTEVFYGVPTSCMIIVPDAQYDAWTAASGWSDLVTAGYTFLRHSGWEYARKYEVEKMAAGKLDAESAFPAFSADSTYAVGDVVTHEGGIYVCSNAVTTAGAWNAADWEATTLAAILSRTVPLVVIDDEITTALASGQSIMGSDVNFAVYWANNVPMSWCYSYALNTDEFADGIILCGSGIDNFPYGVCLFASGADSDYTAELIRTVSIPVAGTYTIQATIAAGANTAFAPRDFDVLVDSGSTPVIRHARTFAADEVSTITLGTVALGAGEHTIRLRGYRGGGYHALLFAVRGLKVELAAGAQ